MLNKLNMKQFVLFTKVILTLGVVSALGTLKTRLDNTQRFINKNNEVIQRSLDIHATTINEIIEYTQSEDIIGKIGFGELEGEDNVTNL